MSKVKDVSVQIRGVSYKPSDLHNLLCDDSVILLRANNIEDDKLNLDDVVYVDKAKVGDTQYLRIGDILICASSGSKNLVGKATIIKENITATFGAFCKVVRPKNILPAYLGYFFISPIYRETISNLSAGANINNIRNEHIDTLEIPIPSNSIQHQIAATLDKVTHTIDLCNAMLEKLDLLVKARFVEMFGEIKEKRTVAEICSIITDGTHQPPVFVESGIPFLFVSNIVTNEICYDATKYISEETYNELYKRTPIEIGDIVLSTVGSYGHPAVVKTNKQFLFQRHIAYLKPISTIINSIYLHSAILSNDVQKQIDERVKGIAQKTLNLSEIRKIVVPIPPLYQQVKFAAFVEQTDKTKAAVQKALDEARVLFDSLMQEYFG